MPNLINYHGGVQLGHMSPMALFASTTWADGTSADWPTGYLFLRCEVDTFFNDFLASTYIGALSQSLPVPQVSIRPGPYAGTTGLSVPAQQDQKGTVSDGSIQAALDSAIRHGVIANTTAPTFYCVLVPPDVVVIDQNGFRNDDPNHGFGGYHGVFPDANAGSINYCVIVGITDMDELTYRLSHETVEHITNSDHTGWYGDPDPIVNREIGVPPDVSPEICDYTAFPIKETAQVHGWQVAKFAYDVERIPDGSTITTAPPNDQVPASKPDHGRIQVDKKSTSTSCLGDIIERQEAYFEATASHYGRDQVISTLSWSSQGDPPNFPVVEVNGNASRTYVLLIPAGCTSVTVRCHDIQTAFLGCLMSTEQDFRVLTQAQANRAALICALIERLKQERWYNPWWWLTNPVFNPWANKVDEAITRIAIAVSRVK